MLPRITALWLEVSTREHYQGQPLDRDLTRFMRSHDFALAHTSYLGQATGEGDHLYLNLRRARGWPYLAAASARRALVRARRLAKGLVAAQ